MAYHFGENTIKRRHRHEFLYAFGILLVVIGLIVAKQTLRPDTKISKTPPAITTRVAADSTPTQQIDESLFQLRLPKDWKLAEHTTQPMNIYTWSSADKVAAGRSLSIYIDTIPTTLGVNRALAVIGDGPHVTPSGDVSENCTSFTAPVSGPAPTSTPAKWNGVPFLCDMGNSLRDVVGTVSTDGLNKVVLSGPASGQHTLFFVYIDNNIEADYTIFINALQSFQLK